MADINITQVRNTVDSLNGIMSSLNDDLAAFDKIISTIEAGWHGTGAQEYTDFILRIKKEYEDYINNIGNVADGLTTAANDAEEADRHAADTINGNGNSTSSGFSNNLIVNSNGQTHLKTDTPYLNQHTQQFTHNEYAGVECTSTALAQCNNINGGSYKNANDYNDTTGQTQIGFYQSGGVEIKNFCEDNLKQGRATCIYYNYAWTGQFDEPGKLFYNEATGAYDIGGGHCVTVIGSDNPTSNNIGDLIVIDPADGKEKRFDQCPGGYHNLFVAVENNPDYHGNATQRAEVEGRLPIWCTHGIY